MFIAAAGAADIIWGIFIGIMVIVSAILKKKKEREEMDERMDHREQARKTGKQRYVANEDAIKGFLEQIGAESPPSPRPQRKPAVYTAEAVSRSQPAEPVSRRIALDPVPLSAYATKPEHLPPPPRVGEDVIDAVEEFREPVTLPARLTMMQRAVIWREILDSPPGLRSGMIFPREV